MVEVPSLYSHPSEYSLYAKARRPSVTSRNSRAGSASADGLQRTVTKKSSFFASRGGELETPQEHENERELTEESDSTLKEDTFIVEWDESDPENPKNWSRAQRWYLTTMSSVLVLNATFASSAPSGNAQDIIAHFGMSRELGTLTIALFVAGYCVGPLLWGPLSEQFGRRPIFLVGFVVYTAFQVGCALAPNTAALLVFRFLSGCFAACPLTNSGAVVSDIWDVDTRGKALAMFTLAPFAGPALGPIVGGYISVGQASWTWVFWVLLIFAFFCLLIVFFTFPETYEPVLLERKAAKKRMDTGDSRYHPARAVQSIPLSKRVEQVLQRPFKMVLIEPMLQLITLYMAFVYGCIYLLFEAYPIVFTQDHHLNAGESGLMFLPIPIGGAIGVLLYILIFDPRYKRWEREFHPQPVPPEYRLEMAVWGGPIYVISFFWFAWTSFQSISFWAPMMSGIFNGWGVTWIYLALFNYAIDAYTLYAASALAAMTVVRSSFGAGFPLFATQMYEKLNPRWASTLLGFIALLLVPVPLVLERFGAKLRIHSQYGVTPPEHLEKQEQEREKPDPRPNSLHMNEGDKEEEARPQGIV